MACGCNKNRSTNSVQRQVRSNGPDPARAVQAAATPRYDVVTVNGVTKRRSFTSLVAAQEYASRTGGSVQPA